MIRGIESWGEQYITLPKMASMVDTESRKE